MLKDPTEILKRQAISYWSHEPGNRPVKITQSQRDPMFWTEGYITSLKFVAGRTLPEVERLLGLPTGELAVGAYLYEFMRLPEPFEFELKGYSQCPDGAEWTKESLYPPGLGVPQWRVARDAYIPSRIAKIVASDQRV